MARIAGVNLPNQKRLEIGLTYIYGIGQPTARKIAAALGLSPDTKIRDLTDDEVTKLRNYIDGELEVEGDLRRERQQAIKRLSEIGAYRGLRHRRGLPVNGQRTKTNARTRKGPKKTVGRGKKAASRWRLPVERRPEAARAAASARTSPSARRTSRRLQQHDRRADRQGGQRHRVGVGRLGRVQGLAQVDAVRRAGHRRRVRAQGHGARPAEGRGVREGPGLGPRDGDPLAPGGRPRDPRRQGRHSRRRTTACGRGSGGASSGTRSRTEVPACAAARA